MTESEILNVAAEVLQRRANMAIEDLQNKEIDEWVIADVMNAGLMMDVVHKLLDIAEVIQSVENTDGD
jgi:hypothetical protein